MRLPLRAWLRRLRRPTAMIAALGIVVRSGCGGGQAYPTDAKKPSHGSVTIQKGGHGSQKKSCVIIADITLGVPTTSDTKFNESFNTTCHKRVWAAAFMSSCIHS